MNKNLLLIFTRNPELGKAKTRLAKTVGDKTALEIYKFLLERTKNISSEVKNADKAVYYSVKIRKNDIWKENIYQKYQQVGEDLGIRMKNAFQNGFDAGYKKVLIIGSDLYDLSSKNIEKAFKELNNNDVVIGPAEDGGYYLLGMNSLQEKVFENKDWGTATVRKNTLENLKDKKVKLLEFKNDIDVYEDIKNIPEIMSTFINTKYFIMKKLLLSTFFIFIFTQTNAQCNENASNFGNNTSTPTYNISGDVTITLNTNNTIALNLGSNFTTEDGPDVRAYLVNSEGKSVSELKSLNPSNLDNIPFGLVSCTGCNPVIPANGAKTLTVAIPNGKDITKFDTIFFYCQQFIAFWDVGSFTPFSASNCAVLDINDFTFNKTSIYPNPAKNKIHFSNIDLVSAEIRIFNVLGKQVYHQSKNKENTIDISTFKKGIYLIKIDVDGKSKTQKLVIQ